MILKGYVFGIAYALVCIALALVAYKLGMPKKFSRKTVHILVGFEWVILAHYMKASYHFLIVCVFFLLLLSVSYFKNLMPMISSDSDNAPGTVYYAVAMTVMAIICLFNSAMLLPFGIGVFCTSLGDGFAGVFGQLFKKYNPKVFGNKTLIGMIANFVFSTGAAVVFKYAFNLSLEIWHCVLIGLFSVGLEVATGAGLDNIAITLGTSFFAYGFIYFSEISNYIVPIVLTPFVISAVLDRRVLTKCALLVALAMDVIITLLLGNFGFVILLSFLVGSVIIDKIKKRRKGLSSVAKRDSDTRDTVQVLANGLIPTVLALMFGLTLNSVFIVAYVASLAEAFSDTAASGIGVFSKVSYDPFRRKKSEIGLSGGMSVLGTVAAFIGAFLISFIAIPFGALDIKLVLVASVSAFLGSLFDSFLGSLLQIKYKCAVCEDITEKEFHCKKPTKRYTGYSFFDNDVVNLFSGAFAAVIAVVVTALI